MLAPFLARQTLREIFHNEPLSDRARDAQLRILVGVGVDVKPFECVGDPDESAVALARVSELDEWSDVDRLAELALEASPDRDFNELLEIQGPSRVPAHWLR
jgi:predicted metal-dependent TIM-barrel fold hydrolase